MTFNNEVRMIWLALALVAWGFIITGIGLRQRPLRITAALLGTMMAVMSFITAASVGMFLLLPAGAVLAFASGRAATRNSEV
ncbi:MAG: hypothetical protein H0U59_06195 [Gemmatimonadaceae bacterium]|nr:hypothetical protein [Gemmatimonadaceae bacterium]